MSEITPNELKARLERNDRPLLLDVRQDWETKLCRLENAVHIPIEEIELRTEELNPDDEIVVYCHQGVPSAARALITDLCAAIDAVHRAPFPVLAAVHGACLGAGFGLALACDLRVAAADASFGLPEVRVGVPSVIQAALLPPLIGPGRAAEMLLLGTPVDAPRALAWGLVNRVVDAAALATVVDETLAALLACAPGAVRAQKALMIRWRETDLPSAVRAGIDAFAACYTGDEPREGAAAFLEKRAPRFGGRVR